MLFAAVLKARPEISEIRTKMREAHDAYWEPRMARIWLAGPLLSDEDARTGQIMIVQADSKEEARTLIGEDPYVVSGCFEPFTVSAFRASVQDGATA